MRESTHGRKVTPDNGSEAVSAFSTRLGVWSDSRECGGESLVREVPGVRGRPSDFRISGEDSSPKSSNKSWFLQFRAEKQTFAGCGSVLLVQYGGALLQRLVQCSNACAAWVMKSVFLAFQQKFFLSPWILNSFLKFVLWISRVRPLAVLSIYSLSWAILTLRKGIRESVV